MKRNALIIFPLSFFIAGLFSVGPVFAATLTLDKIGTYTVTGGKPVGKVFYTDHFPTFSGKATSESRVTVSILGLEDGITTASPAGDWSYKPTKELTKGDYKITISSAGETISFDLGIETGLPASGADLTTILILGSVAVSLGIFGLAAKKGYLTLGE